MKKITEDRGFISLFVLIAMLFLLIFMFGIYMNITTKKSLEYEKDTKLKEVYMQDKEEIKSKIYANAKEIIPIKNNKILDLVGTSKSVEIDNKIFKCDRSNSYVLTDNIITDIKEDLMMNKVKFNDFKFYLNTYFIDKNGYDNYYYYKDVPNKYWKVIAYQEFSEDNKTILNHDTCKEKEFRILNNLDLKLNRNADFLMLWTDEKNMLKNIDVQSQVIEENISSLNQISVFSKNINNVDKSEGRYYLMLNVGEID